MAYNSYKEDEKSVEKSKLQTLKRLFSYQIGRASCRERV